MSVASDSTHPDAVTLRIGSARIRAEKRSEPVFFAPGESGSRPLVYKAYPGLGHTGSNFANELGLACFRYAVREREKARTTSGGKSDKPDWKSIFAASPYVADVVNQLVARRENEKRLPKEFRMMLPDAELVRAWRQE